MTLYAGDVHGPQENHMYLFHFMTVRTLMHFCFFSVTETRQTASEVLLC